MSRKTISGLEYNKFTEDINGETAVRVVTAPLPSTNIEQWDEIQVQLNSDNDVYSYYLDGSLIGAVTILYTNNSKKDILRITRS